MINAPSLAYHSAFQATVPTAPGLEEVGFEWRTTDAAEHRDRLRRFDGQPRSPALKGYVAQLRAKLGLLAAWSEEHRRAAVAAGALERQLNHPSQEDTSLLGVLRRVTGSAQHFDVRSNKRQIRALGVPLDMMSLKKVGRSATLAFADLLNAVAQEDGHFLRAISLLPSWPTSPRTAFCLAFGSIALGREGYPASNAHEGRNGLLSIHGGEIA